jgi:hypothetical protein
MGPFSEKKQLERADSIQRLLDSNPQLDDHMKGIWLKHQRNLCLNEDEYNKRVKNIFTNSFKPNGYFDYLND